MIRIAQFSIVGILASMVLAAHAEEPKIVTRPAVHYVGVRVKTPMQKLGEVIPVSYKEALSTLAKHGLKPHGPLFIRYHVVAMPRELDIEMCVPVAKPIAVTGRVHNGTLPAGRYVSLTHTGHPRELVQANGDLQNWAKKEGLRLQQIDKPAGSEFKGRAELELVGPAEQPDMNKWTTEVIYLIDESAKKP